MRTQVADVFHKLFANSYCMELLDDLTELHLDVDEWLNSEPLGPEDLRGKVVLVEAFQMLCPGCVNHGLPQAVRVHRSIRSEQLVVIGLHTVFEHHEVMTRDALAVFLSEFGIRFPVAIDRNDGQRLPVTMRRYDMQGTPTMLLVDRNGRIRHSLFGQIDDLTLGVRLGQLLSEPAGTDMES